MARLTGLFQRGPVWWLRVMIPLDLRPSYGGRTKVVRSLGTSERRRAALLATTARSELLRDFEGRRTGVPLPASGVAPTSPGQPQGSAAPLHQPEPGPDFLTSGNGRSLRMVYDKWAAATEGGKDAKAACGRALKLYEEWAGTTASPIEAITRAEGHDFKAWLLAKTKAGVYSSKTAHSYLGSVCSLLRFAHRELEWTPRHAWLGISIDYETETPRARWLPHHFAVMSALPLFASMQVPTGWQSGGMAAYWLPLLGLYTGGTVSELAQLKVADVLDEGDAGLWLRFTDTGEGQGLKTVQRRRTVPLHSELLRLGFGDYVKALQASGAASLWPACRLHKDKPGIHFSNWWGKFRRAADGTEVLPDFHSMRHTARSTMADSGLDAALLDVITGHGKRGSEGVRTYTHFSRDSLRAAVETIRYPLLCALPRRFVTADDMPAGKGPGRASNASRRPPRTLAAAQMA